MNDDILDITLGELVELLELYPNHKISLSEIVELIKKRLDASDSEIEALAYTLYLQLENVIKQYQV